MEILPSSSQQAVAPPPVAVKNRIELLAEIFDMHMVLCNNDWFDSNQGQSYILKPESTFPELKSQMFRNITEIVSRYRTQITTIESATESDLFHAVIESQVVGNVNGAFLFPLPVFRYFTEPGNASQLRYLSPNVKKYYLQFLKHQCLTMQARDDGLLQPSQHRDYRTMITPSNWTTGTVRELHQLLSVAVDIFTYWNTYRMRTDDAHFLDAFLEKYEGCGLK